MTATADPAIAAGTRWTSLHLHVHWSAAQTDEFLTGTLGPMLDARAADGLLGEWFFIRYWMGGPHLRVRATGVADAAELAAALRAAVAAGPAPEGEPRPGWTAHGTVLAVPYEPETQRYGGEEPLPIAEKVFAASTRAALRALASPVERRMAAAMALVYATGVALGFGDRAIALWLRRHAGAWRWVRETEMLPAATVLARTAAVRADHGTPVTAALRAVRAGRADSAVGEWTADVADADRAAAAVGLEGPRRAAVWASQVHMLCNRMGVAPDEERALCWLLAAILLDGLEGEDYSDTRYLERSRYEPGQFGPLPVDDEHSDGGLPWARFARRITLPPGPDLDAPLGAALGKRSSGRAFGGSLPASSLGGLLRGAYGALGSRTVLMDDGVRRSYERRPFPSAGAKVATRLRLLALSVDDVPSGTYHVDTDGATLVRLGSAPTVDDLRASSMWFSTDRRPGLIDIRSVPAILVLSVDLGVLRPRYGLRSLRFAALESGHVAQNLALCAAALDLSMITLGGFFDDLVHELAGLDGVDEVAQYLIPLGKAVS
ncbi:thiopeptide-type bacteriocin biosynthesis protein [Actinokineospora guangxiensis]|uniref:Thiopeptide-type bacteriocin biosynthesis protein n=1 Tax=Actinokineospora guangxiensis TaxID=1490288 RepID=A0ABW0EV11_9PSEU